MSYSLQEAYLSIYSEEFKDLTPDKSERVKARHAELFSDIMKDHDEVNRLRKKPFLRYRSGTKQKIRELVGRIKKNSTLAQNAGDALIRTSVSKEAKIKHLKNKISELEPKNKIVKFQREEIELILNYLLDEGYADSFDTAELIFENMSDEWMNNILNEGTWQQAIMRAFGNMGKSDYPVENPTTLSDTVRRQRQAEGAMRGITPLNRATIRGRHEAGRNRPGERYQGRVPSDNPNYQGPMVGIPGTRDRMPGTSPSPNPNLPRGSQKYTSGTVVPKTTNTYVHTPAQRTYGRNLGYT